MRVVRWNKNSSPESIALMSYPHIKSGVLSTQVDGIGFGLGVGVVMDAKTILFDRDEDYFWSGFYSTNFCEPTERFSRCDYVSKSTPLASPWPGSFGVFLLQDSFWNLSSLYFDLK